MSSKYIKINLEDIVEFGKRKLDGYETNLDGKYLLQWLCYPVKMVNKVICKEDFW